MDDLLQSTDARGVATLTLNRPSRRNAFDGALVTNLTDALLRLEARRDVRVVMLCGAGDSFSAGADIEWLKRGSSASFDENLAEATKLAKLMHTLDRLSKPTLAFVHGAAYGGGVGLAACSDIVIATERARFCLSEAKLGIIAAVIAPFVVRAVGARQARRLMLTADAISAEEARRIGLAHEIASDAEAPAVRENVIAALLRCAPRAQAEVKSLVSLCEGSAIDDALARETARRIAVLRASPEGREGLAAFLEKRAPNWRGGGSSEDVSKAADR
jgi:methylglutaconyl-CoA hydratase